MLSCLLIPSWSDSPFPSEEWEVNKFCGYFLPFVIEFCNGRPFSWLLHSNAGCRTGGVEYRLNPSLVGLGCVLLFMRLRYFPPSQNGWRIATSAVNGNT